MHRRARGALLCGPRHGCVGWEGELGREQAPAPAWLLPSCTPTPLLDARPLLPSPPCSTRHHLRQGAPSPHSPRDWTPHSAKHLLGRSLWARPSLLPVKSTGVHDIPVQCSPTVRTTSSSTYCVFLIGAPLPLPKKQIKQTAPLKRLIVTLQTSPLSYPCPLNPKGRGEGTEPMPSPHSGL